MLMERELNKGGKTDEKIQSIDWNAARGNRSVFFALGWNAFRFCAAFIVLYKLLGKNQKYFLEKY